MGGMTPWRREQVLTGIYLAVLLSGGFYLLDWYNAARLASGTRFRSLGFEWEQYVPVWPEWIWVYLAYFPGCATPLLLQRVRHDPDVFRRTAFGFALQYAIAFPFFLLPVRMLQAQLLPATLSERALAWFYQIDPGFNVFPSLHVANMTYVACVVWRFGGRLAGALVWTLCGAIAVSTLFVKQHYFVDLPAGMLLGLGAHRVAFGRRVA